MNTKWPLFNPFQRHPTSLLAWLRMIIVGPFLLPIRLIGAVTTLSIAWLWATLLTIGLSDEILESEPYSPLRRTLILGGLRVFARILFRAGAVLSNFLNRFSMIPCNLPRRRPDK